MRRKFHLKSHLIIGLTIVILADSFIANDTGAQQAAKESRPEALVELLQLRHDVLEERWTAIQRRIEDGSLPQEHTYSARDELLKAKLELASTHQERRDLCKLRVVNLQSFEELIKSHVKSGEKPLDEQLLATAARLEVEIECLREGFRRTGE